MAQVTFKAIFSDSSVLEWENPQTWRHVFHNFKLWADVLELTGVLYCNGIVIRETGRKPSVMEGGTNGR